MEAQETPACSIPPGKQHHGVDQPCPSLGYTHQHDPGGGHVMTKTHLTLVKQPEMGLGLLPAWRLEIVRVPGIPYDGRAPIRGPADAAAIAREYIGQADREHILVIMLDTKNR